MLTSTQQYIYGLYDTASAFFFGLVSELSMNDPVMKPVISLFLLGAVSWLIRSLLIQLPGKIKTFLLRRFTVTMDIVDDYADFASNYGRFTKFQKEQTTKGFLNHNLFRLQFQDGESFLTPSGKNSFWYKGRFFWLASKRLEDKASNGRVVTILSVTTIGRSEKALDELVRAFASSKKNVPMNYYKDMHNNWAMGSPLNLLSLSDLSLPADFTDQLLRAIDKFETKKEWYEKNKLDHKLNILLYGPPGTGKSSLAKAIAKQMHRSLYRSPLWNIARTIRETATECKSTGITLVEEFDNNRAYMNRQEDEDNDRPHITGNEGLEDLLNVLEGTDSNLSQVTIFTTNHLEKIDPAVYRDSRFTLVLYVGFTQREEMIDFITRRYGEFDHSLINEIGPVPMSILSGSFSKEPEDLGKFLSLVSQAYYREKDKLEQLGQAGLLQQELVLTANNQQVEKARLVA